MAFLLDTSILVRLANTDDVQNPVAVRADKLAMRLFFLAMVYRFLYTIRMKPIAFRGSSLDDLKAFPQDARREAGYPLDKV